MTEKKILDAHRLSFIYEYIFCRCFPHKIIDVDFCVVLAIDSEVEHAVSSDRFGSAVSFLPQDEEPPHVCLWAADPQTV